MNYFSLRELLASSSQSTYEFEINKISINGSVEKEITGYPRFHIKSGPFCIPTTKRKALDQTKTELLISRNNSINPIKFWVDHGKLATNSQLSTLLIFLIHE